MLAINKQILNPKMLKVSSSIMISILLPALPSPLSPTQPLLKPQNQIPHQLRIPLIENSTTNLHPRPLLLPHNAQTSIPLPLKTIHHHPQSKPAIHQPAPLPQPHLPERRDSRSIHTLTPYPVHRSVYRCYIELRSLQIFTYVCITYAVHRIIISSRHSLTIV